MNSYADANAKLGSRSTRKLDYRTYLERRSNDSIAVRFWETDVVTYFADGTIALNSGGWRTPTTKSRINEYAPVNVWQEKGVWYIGAGWKERSYIFQDNVLIHADGKIEGCGQAPDKKLLKQAKVYAHEFVEALAQGNVPKPSGGDCWFCGMVTEEGRSLGAATRNSEHLLSHFEEKYFVPSLVTNAIKRFPVSKAAEWFLGAVWSEEGPRKLNHFEEIGKSQIEKAIYRFVKEQLGFAS